jgi:hypothetical protein
MVAYRCYGGAVRFDRGESPQPVEAACQRWRGRSRVGARLPELAWPPPQVVLPSLV